MDELVADLREKGFPPTADQIAAAYAILLSVAAGTWPGGYTRLAFLLAPIFTQSDAAQPVIRDCVNKRAAQLLGTNDTYKPPPAVPTDIVPTRNIDRSEKRFDRIHMALPLLIVALLSLSVWKTSTPDPITPPPPEKPISAPVSVAVQKDITSAFTQRIAPPIAVTAPIPKQVILLREVDASPWGWVNFVLLGAGPLVAGLAFLAWYWGRTRRWQSRSFHQPRDLSEIRILFPGTGVFETDEVDPSAHDLDRHRRPDVGRIDVIRSVEATVRSAGLPTLIPPTLRATVEYTAVIEEHGRHDHVARLADVALEQLRKSGVLFRRFYTGAGERVRDEVGRAIDSRELAERFQGTRLLVIGSGDALLSNAGQQLKRPFREDAGWGERALLSPDRVDRVTTRALIANGYTLAQLSSEGLKALAQRFASGRETQGVLPWPEGVVQARPTPEKPKVGLSSARVSPQL